MFQTCYHGALITTVMSLGVFFCCFFLIDVFFYLKVNFKTQEPYLDPSWLDQLYVLSIEG